MNSAGTTTTWYAFQDPKSGREYFHEPQSGSTSWVLPNTFDGSESINSVMTSSKTSKQNQVDTSSTSPRHEQSGWSTVGMTIAFILVFNTLFLFALTYIYANNNGPRLTNDHMKIHSGNSEEIIYEKKNEIMLTSPSSDNDDNYDDDIETTIQKDEEVLAIEGTPDPPETQLMDIDAQSYDANMHMNVIEEQVQEYNIEDNSFTVNNHEVNADGCSTDAIEEETSLEAEEVIIEDVSIDEQTVDEEKDEELSPHEVIIEDVSSLRTDYEEKDEELVSHETSESVHEEKDNNVVENPSNKIIDRHDTSQPGGGACMIPFSYILVRKCRSKAREGMALALDNNSLWI